MVDKDRLNILINAFYSEKKDIKKLEMLRNLILKIDNSYSMVLSRDIENFKGLPEGVVI
ncbi:MAG TPA: hypothetical protein PKJ95_00485 [Atribacterota bacterium]|nr:hypothetical protein [Atribacterota bacterium]